jgi:hypothetical protein
MKSPAITGTTGISNIYPSGRVRHYRPKLALAPRTWEKGFFLVNVVRPVFVGVPDVHIVCWPVEGMVPGGSQADRLPDLGLMRPFRPELVAIRLREAACEVRRNVEDRLSCCQRLALLYYIAVLDLSLPKPQQRVRSGVFATR